nr:A24 family peptidase [Homoserinimonas sp. OAct 916]
MVAVGVGIFGALIGSFLNVVVYRVPAGRSIVSPPSACMGCGQQIRGYDNIPVLSWLVLRGKCRGCRAGISVRYPLVELGTAVFFGVVAWWGVSGGLAATLRDGRFAIPQGTELAGAELAALVLAIVAFLWLAGVSVALALIDLDTKRLPNVIVLPSYLVGGALLAASSILIGNYSALITAGIGLVAMWVAYYLMAIAYPGGMGFGDVKLAGVLGLYLGWLGWGPLAVGAFSAFLLGGFFSLALLLARRADRKSGIPFGPWMLAGAWLGIFFGESIWTAYLTLYGLA